MLPDIPEVLRRARTDAPFISVVVKAYNEETRVERCLRSALETVAGFDAEVILADSLSTDRTVEIARGLPVRIVQMTRAHDRGCGAGAQLGYQYAQGQFILLVDADMELLTDFLVDAVAAFAADPRLAAVGGQQIEMSDALEYQERQRRGRRRPGITQSIGGSALYRAAAVRDVGYFMNRNLHCAEEFELAVRLRSRGWRLRILDCAAYRHYGHLDSPVELLGRRWRAGFFTGFGAMLRSAWLKPYFAEILRACALPLLVIVWWGGLAAFVVTAVFYDRRAGWALVVAGAFPVAALLLRKRSLTRALHAFTLWQFHAAALLQGLFAQQVKPDVPVAAVTIQQGDNQGDACQPRRSVTDDLVIRR